MNFADEVSLGGTIRLTDTSLYEKLFSTLTLRVKEIAIAYGCTAEVIDRNGEKGYNSRGEEFKIFAFPPNVNSDEILDLGIATANKMYGESSTQIYTGKRTGNMSLKRSKIFLIENFQQELISVSIMSLLINYNHLLTGCEDFAFLSQLVPSCQFRIGTKSLNDKIGSGTGTQGHNPKFEIDESALPRGAAFMSTVALEYLLKAEANDINKEL